MDIEREHKRRWTAELSSMSCDFGLFAVEGVARVGASMVG
jgi:hypothetical protein